MDVGVLSTPASAHEGPLGEANFVQENQLEALGFCFIELCN